MVHFTAKRITYMPGMYSRRQHTAYQSVCSSLCPAVVRQWHTVLYYLLMALSLALKVLKSGSTRCHCSSIHRSTGRYPPPDAPSTHFSRMVRQSRSHCQFSIAHDSTLRCPCLAASSYVLTPHVNNVVNPCACAHSCNAAKLPRHVPCDGQAQTAAAARDRDRWFGEAMGPDQVRH